MSYDHSSSSDYFPATSTTKISFRSSRPQRSSHPNTPRTPPSTPSVVNSLSFQQSPSDEILMLNITRYKLEQAIQSQRQVSMNQGSGGGNNSNSSLNQVAHEGRNGRGGIASLRQLVLLQNCYSTLRELWYRSSAQAQLEQERREEEERRRREIEEVEEWDMNLSVVDSGRIWLDGVFEEMQEHDCDEEETWSIQNYSTSRQSQLNSQATSNPPSSVTTTSNSNRQQQEIEDSGFLEASKYFLSSPSYHSTTTTTPEDLELSSDSHKEEGIAATYSFEDYEDEEGIVIDDFELSSPYYIPPYASLHPSPSPASLSLSTTAPVEIPGTSHHDYLDKKKNEVITRFESVSVSPPGLTPDSSPINSPSFEESFLYLLKENEEEMEEIEEEKEVKRRESSRERGHRRKESFELEFELGLKRVGLLDLVKGKDPMKMMTRREMERSDYFGNDMEGNLGGENYFTIPHTTTSNSSLHHSHTLTNFITPSSTDQFNFSLFSDPPLVTNIHFPTFSSREGRIVETFYDSKEVGKGGSGRFG